MNDTQDKESIAWAEYQIAKRNAKVRRTRTGILRQLKALEHWEQAADENFEKYGRSMNHSHSQEQGAR